jgi:hypothetical protein
MKKMLIYLTIFAALVLGSAANVQPVTAGTGTVETCDEIYFYIYNGTNTEVFVDVTNWTTRERWLTYLSPHQEAKFTLPFSGADGIEFWVEPVWYIPDHWYLGDWIAVYECSYVAAYIKDVKGPALNVRVVSLED